MAELAQQAQAASIAHRQRADATTRELDRSSAQLRATEGTTMHDRQKPKSMFNNIHV